MNENDITSAAEQAAEVEAEAQEQPEVGVYVHQFKKPWSYNGNEITSLTFDWTSLTGADHMEIENEMLMEGRTLITPEFSGDFLWGMARKACDMKIRPDAAKEMPMRDFQVITKKARSFLLKSGS
jgi:hypothetical protein